MFTDIKSVLSFCTRFGDLFCILALGSNLAHDTHIYDLFFLLNIFCGVFFLLSCFWLYLHDLPLEPLAIMVCSFLAIACVRPWTLLQRFSFYHHLSPLSCSPIRFPLFMKITHWSQAPTTPTACTNIWVFT